MEQETAKIKYICRLTEEGYTEELRTQEASSEDAQSAQTLLHAFAPERVLRQMQEQGCGEAVLVFRTDAAQMAEFRTLLENGDMPGDSQNGNSSDDL